MKEKVSSVKEKSAAKGDTIMLQECGGQNGASDGKMLQKPLFRYHMKFLRVGM